MKTPVDVLGVGVHPLTWSELLALVGDFIQDGLPHTVAYANVHVINTAARDVALRDFLAEVDVCYCDGNGVVLGARLLGREIPERMTGADWIWSLAEVAAAKAAVIKEEKKATPGKSLPPVPFSEEYLASTTNIDVGGEIWAAQCRHCHGAKAYPGKAPKLKPAKYKPDWVYSRVTDGFRKMPAWKDEYSDDERMKIVAYIMSGSFSP